MSFSKLVKIKVPISVINFSLNSSYHTRSCFLEELHPHYLRLSPTTFHPSLFPPFTLPLTINILLFRVVIQSQPPGVPWPPIPPLTFPSSTQPPPSLFPPVLAPSSKPLPLPMTTTIRMIRGYKTPWTPTRSSSEGLFTKYLRLTGTWPNYRPRAIPL